MSLVNPNTSTSILSELSEVKRPLKWSRISEIKNKQSFIWQFFNIDSVSENEPTIKCVKCLLIDIQLTIFGLDQQVIW